LSVVFRHRNCETLRIICNHKNRPCGDIFARYNAVEIDKG
jgi:hypothetical protein